MIKLIQTTDTHYGHSRNTHKIHEKFLDDLAKVIAENDIKALIHSGDWTSYRQDQFARTLAMFRRYIHVPILTVRGNHDLWQGGDRHKYGYVPTYGQMLQEHEKLFKDNGIYHLENGPYIIDDVAIYGFDGWYNHANPPTNDDLYMGFTNIEGAPTHQYLGNRAHKKLDDLLATDMSQYRKTVLVTHHPSFTEDMMYKDLCANLNFFHPIVDKFDVYCTGHSHVRSNNMHNGCLLINSGSDYDDPRSVIFEV